MSYNLGGISEMYAEALAKINSFSLEFCLANYWATVTPDPLIESDQDRAELSSLLSRHSDENLMWLEKLLYASRESLSTADLEQERTNNFYYFFMDLVGRLSNIINQDPVFQGFLAKNYRPDMPGAWGYVMVALVENMMEHMYNVVTSRLIKNIAIQTYGPVSEYTGGRPDVPVATPVGTGPGPDMPVRAIPFVAQIPVGTSDGLRYVVAGDASQEMGPVPETEVTPATPQKASGGNAWTFGIILAAAGLWIMFGKK